MRRRSTDSPDLAAEELVPLLRGVLHAYAFWFALAAATALVAIAPTAEARWASAIYGGGLCALFAISATYHRWRWNPRWRPVLRQLDHSTIFVFIAASTTPVALLVLDGTIQTVVLASAWSGAAAGVAMSVCWIDAPRWLNALTYVLVGWAAAAGLPDIVARLPAAPLVLLAVGGGLYMAGAAVYATQRPNLWPRTFGFHEVFHALVILAAVAHFVSMAGWIVPGAGAGA
jgi:hemolysin III